jgi:hypothetical protein
MSCTSDRGSAVCTIKPGDGDGGGTDDWLFGRWWRWPGSFSGGGDGGGTAMLGEPARPSGSWVDRSLSFRPQKSLYPNYLEAKAYRFRLFAPATRRTCIIDDDGGGHGSHRSTLDWSINLGKEGCGSGMCEQFDVATRRVAVRAALLGGAAAG